MKLWEGKYKVGKAGALAHPITESPITITSLNSLPAHDSINHCIGRSKCQGGEFLFQSPGVSFHKLSLSL